MSKGPHSPRDGARGKARPDSKRGRRAAKKGEPVPPAAPSLVWAKWIDALGEGEPLPDETPEAAEARLRAATEAAERARLEREAATAAAEEARAVEPSRDRRSRERITVPPRHAPELIPGAALIPRARVSPPVELGPAPPVELGPAPPPRFIDAPLEPEETFSSPTTPPSSPMVLPSVPLPAHSSGLPTGFPIVTPTAPPIEPVAAPRPLPPTPAPAPDRLGDEPLPDRYADDRITLICRDPNWLHAYWDLNPASVSRARALLDAASDQFVLRLHHYPVLAGQESGHVEIAVSALARNWYLHGGRPGHAFEIEIGLRAADGRFVAMARSNRVTAPLDRMSEVVDEKWRSLAADDERMYALSGGYEPRGTGSGELQELVARRMDEFMGSGLAGSFGPWSASAPPPRGARHPGFWFVLGTELVVYGATDPNATVTCQGRPVPLRPDGTFTLRFALPEGAQAIECRALAADRSAAITITPALTKTTTREEKSHRSASD